MKKNKLWLLLTVLSMTLLLFACNNDKDSDSGNSEGGGGDLIIAELSDAQSLDPHGSNDIPSSNVAANIYEQLVSRDAEGNLIPFLATSWEQKDELTWEFKLKDGVVFHDGEKFNAEAVKKNLDRIRDPEIGSPRAYLFEMITDVKVIDDLTVQIVTEYPFSPLLAHLTHPGGGMISPKAIEADYEAMKSSSDGKAGSYINQNPTGTGPFKFVSWEPGTQIKLERFKDYSGPGKAAKVDTVTFKVVPESGTRIAELESGYAHIIGTVEPGQVEKVNSLSNASVNETPAASITYIGFNLKKEPFNNKLVRQAISKAVDRKSLIEGIYEGHGVEAISPMSPGVFGYTDDLPSMEYNIEEAKKLLAEAGYANGFKTTIWTNDNPARQNVAIVLQEELKKLNIELNIEVLEWGSYLEKTAAGEHDMFILGWSNSTLDADNGLYALFHSSQQGEAGNRTFYASDKVDELLVQGRQEADPDKRAAIYKEVLQNLAEDAPVANVLHPSYLIGVSNDVSGFRISQDGIYQLRDVTIKK